MNKAAIKSGLVYALCQVLSPLKHDGHVYQDGDDVVLPWALAQELEAEGIVSAGEEVELISEQEAVKLDAAQAGLGSTPGPESEPQEPPVEPRPEPEPATKDDAPVVENTASDQVEAVKKKTKA